MAHLDISAIAKYMSSLLVEYNRLRFLPSRGTVDFWDVVVLTACNEEQKAAYELMLQSRIKSSSNPLPSFVDYVVIADPPECKVGNGGSTMHALYELEQRYGGKLSSFRVLLLHCGGQSQRLPCTSVLGKVFAPLPVGQPMSEFIDLKLCNYLPLLKNMKPGVFLVSSDDIQPMCLLDSSLPETCQLVNDGFSVLAHPSTLEIGTKHGVYVLPTEEKFDTHVSLMPVTRVLQKPTIKTLHAANAVLHQSNGDEFCYSDSAFFFSHSISYKLLQLYKELKPLSCEVDAYGDFLQCLGPHGTSDYVKDDRNVSVVSSTLVETRLRVFNLLHDQPVRALVLPQSAYIHFGTMPEYINNMVDPEYVPSKAHANTPGLRHFFEPFSSTARGLTVVDSFLHSSFSCGASASIMRSVVGADVHFESPSCSVVEYSILTSKLFIAAETIVSHCIWRHSSESLHIPSGLFLYTICVRGGGFATVAFGIYDDLKANSPFRDLKYLNGKVRIGAAADAFDIPTVNDRKVNLWTTKLFKVHTTPEEAFASAVKFVSSLLAKEDESNGDHKASKLPKLDHFNEYHSIADLLQNKDINEIIKLRQATIL